MMPNYQKARVKLTNTQKNKLKSAAKTHSEELRKTFKIKNCHMNYF